MQIQLGDAACGVCDCEFYEQDVTAYVDVAQFGEGWVDDAAIAEECGHTVSGWYSWTVEDARDSIHDL